MNFKGEAKRLADEDLPRIGSAIDVGEDILHAIMDAEAPKSGFDAQGRPRILFEPHIFWRELGKGAKRDRAVREGLAYEKWKSGAYGKESEQYGKLERAMAIDPDAALRSCSWGRGQVMGFNHAMVGFVSARSMVEAFMRSEADQIEAIVKFMASKKLDGHLRRIDALTRPSTPDDWRPVASGYNGAGYEKNGYHTTLSQRFNFWRTIPDTPWTHDEPIVAPTPKPPEPIVEPARVEPPAAPAPTPLTAWARLARLFGRA